ncbi:hypothetical protein DESC_480177 [Desulfosarcina cetonica]|uniref:response regulator n=1 Tax=Desulfosarcina cetonica TaxID=90730 RepID=UPI0006CF8EA0|nr:response regulator [Desulfosarcina cetonica]VTR66467.1 hypothetical protein DESC_480177 [Desulfosarcina cetonica]
MSVITLFSGIFCNADAVVRDLMQSTGYPLIDDDRIVAMAADLSGMPEGKIRRAFSAKTSVFNKFTHEKEYSIACLRLALATELARGPAVVFGACGLLLPQTIAHVLRVCLIAETPYRIAQARDHLGLDEEESLHQIHRADADNAAWIDTLWGMADPWNESLYDSALALVDEDEPEVMIIDLKMPGIDGMEILRQIKKTRPQIEVIVLTGHGSEHDRQQCMALGAFAYLQKPVDIEALSQTLKMAHAKIRHAND